MSCYFFNHQVLLLLAVWTAIASGEDEGSTASHNTQAITQAAAVTPALPTVGEDGMRLCHYYDSRANRMFTRRRYCPLHFSCFSYIYRREDGGVRIKKGCNYLCQNESRARKIQKCCTGHLCNDHILSEEDFTRRVPPQCHQSRTNATCNMTTACYSRQTRLSNGTYVFQQGCIRGRTCNESSEGNILQTCCTADLCNDPIPISTTPRTPASTTPTFIPTRQMSTQSYETPPTTSTFTPPNIKPDSPSDNTSPTPTTDHTSLLDCHCDRCGRDITCRGFMCAYAVYNRTSTVAMTADRICLNDTSVCLRHSWDVYPNATIVCCNSYLCNIKLPGTTTTTITSTITITDTDSSITTPTHNSTDHTSDKTTSSLVSTTTVSTSLLLSDQYFTVAAVGSVIGGVLVVGIILSAMVVLIVHHQRKNKTEGILPRQPPSSSPDCHVPVCYSKTTTKGSPCITSSESSIRSLQNEDMLKYLGTSV